MDKDFLELKDKPITLRLTRSEKATGGSMVIMQEKKVDLYDMMDPVDILAKYNSEWADKTLEMKAWKEKKDALDQLISDASVPKLKSGDYMGLTKMLKKLIVDANVVVSQTAVKTCGVLAKGLRKDFGPYAKELMAVLFGRFKEKKLLLLEEVIQALDLFLNCINLEIILPDIIAGLSDKGVPTVKKNICLFIDKAAQITYIDVLQRASGDLLVILIKLSDD